MTIYSPDAWVILRIKLNDTEVIHKVLAGWVGGFVDADSWRLNSGITRVEVDGDYYVLHGHSGSTYRVHKKMQRTTMLTASVLARIQDDVEDPEVCTVVDIAELL